MSLQVLRLLTLFRAVGGGFDISLLDGETASEGAGHSVVTASDCANITSRSLKAD